MSNYILYKDLANLLHAVRDNDLSFIKANIRSELLNLKNSYHISLLKYAVIYAKKDIVEFLFEQQDINHNVLDHNILDDKSWNVLHNAAFLASNDDEHLNLYKYLLEKGVNPHQKSVTGLYPFQTRYNDQNLCKQLWELTRSYWSEEISEDVLSNFKNGIAVPVEPLPEQPKLAEPLPEQPKLVEPSPEQPKPVEPSPEQPKPVEPLPEQPKSVEPLPEQPKPVEPSPEQPKPVEPSPEQPKLVEPSPEQPKLVEPSPEQPKLVEPSPEQPKLVEPSPEQPLPECLISDQARYIQPKPKQSVMLFCGQGSQKVGMLSEYVKDQVAKDLNTTASEILGYDLMDVCIRGPESKLNQTDVLQPALLLASIIQFKKLNIKPSICAGFSLGEYSALVASGAISFEDGIRLLKVRGKAMLEASNNQCPSGMISVVGLEDNIIDEICKTCNVSIANYLFPKGRVLSGTITNIDKAEKMADSRGALKVIKLTVSGGFHSYCMESAKGELKSKLDNIKIIQPSCTVYSNVTGEPYTDPEQIRQLLSEQITKPVQWETLMNNIANLNIDEYFELGIGSQLQTISRRISEKECNKFQNFKVC
jgi:[acyl-carrier-protein] S-malonyltransferase